MSRQILFTLIACIGAVCVLVLTIVLSPPIDGGEDDGSIDPDGTPRFRGVDPDEESKSVNSLRPGMSPDGGEFEDLYVRRIDQKKKQITIFRGEAVRPRKNGVSDVDNPRAEIHLIPGRRVMVIEGREGTLVAPQNNPESGVMRGGVILSLYDAPPGVQVMMGESSPHTQLRLYLDEDVQFDLTRGRVDSAGPVHLTTPRVDFRGTDLSLQYNEVRKRLSWLRVAQGNELRFNPAGMQKDREAGDAADAQARNSDAKSDAGKSDAAKSDTGKSDTSKGDTGDEKGDDTDKPAPQPDYYVANFEQDVRIRSEQATITASELAIVFGFGEKHDEEDMLLEISRGDDSDSGPLSPRERAGVRAGLATDHPNRSGSAVPPSALTLTLSQGERGPEPTANAWRSSTFTTRATSNNDQRADRTDRAAQRSLAPHSKDDLIINWTGSLIVEPIDEKPLELTGPDDSLLLLTGPVRVETPRGETIDADTIEYLTSSDTIRMTGSQQTPLVIISRKLGRLTAPKLVVDQRAGVGRISGAGQITAHADSFGREDAKGDAKNAEPLPPNLTIRWTDHVDLSFFLDEGQPNGEQSNRAADDKADKAESGIRPTSNLDALRAATFYGGVGVEHPQIDLEADRLKVTMSDPTAGAGKPTRIEAHGQVRANARGEDTQQPMDIAAGELDLEFTKDSQGDAQPHRLIARKNVKTNLDGRFLSAGLLDVTLAEEPAPRNVARAANDNPRADNVDNSVDDSGANNDVVAKGEDAQAREAASGDADVKTKKSEPFKLEVTWQDRMRFNNRSGYGHFAGKVQATSERTLDVTRFRADDLTLQVDPAEVELGGLKPLFGEEKKDAKEKPASRKVDDGEKGEQKKPKLAIKRVIAEDNVHVHTESPLTDVVAARLEADLFRGEHHVYGTEEQPARVQREHHVLIGPHIQLREDDQLVEVIGPGKAEFSNHSLVKAGDEESKDDDEKNEKPKNGEEREAQTGDRSAEGNQADDGDKPSAQGVASNGSEKTDDRAKPQAAKDERGVQRISARGKVIFEAEQWADKVGGRLDTRFRLTGPLLSFDNASEQINVIGPGSMQIEDYRAKRAKEGPNANAGAAVRNQPGPVAFVNKGVTLFIWKGQLTMDAGRNDIRMDKDVQMIQLAAGESEPVQMDCQSLVADFARSGGLKVWLAGDAPEPKLDNLIAQEKVRLIHRGQTLTGHRLEYNGARELAILSAKEGDVCHLEDAKSVLPAKRFRWHLDKDKIVAEEPGAVRVKVGE